MSLSRRIQPLALAFAMVAMPMTEALAQQVYDVADVVEKIMPTVATIATETPEDPETGESGGTGSGFVYNAKQGYIITNNHVIENATAIVVTLGGFEYDGTLIGTDVATDIAVVQITPDPARPLVAVRFGNSDQLRVGNGVIAIGAPYEYAQTVTTGIISAKDREIGAGPYDQFLQTDAAINPGNSGGPLFNVRGQLMGMNTAIFSPTGTSAGIGFSIPSNQIAWVAEQLIEHGKVNWGYLGVGLRALRPEERAANNIPANQQGIAVSNILGASPSKDILQSGDVITALNGTAVNSPRQLRIMIGQLLAGTPIELTVRRSGVESNVAITLSTRPEKKEPAAEQQQPNQQNEREQQDQGQPQEQEQTPEGEMPPGGQMPVTPGTEEGPEEDASSQRAIPGGQQLKRASLRLSAPAP